MPDFIDKTNAIAWINAPEQRGKHAWVKNYCEALSSFGSSEVSTKHLINSLSIHKDVVWLCIEKTSKRNTTRSFEVYIMPNNFIEHRVTTLMSALCRVDRDGMVKVNYWHELEQMIKLIDPYATIRRF